MEIVIGNDDDGLPLYVGILVGNNSCKLVLPLFLLKGWHCQSSVYILSPILLSLDKLNNSGYFVYTWTAVYNNLFEKVFSFGF
jgi:hypothetical protein